MKQLRWTILIGLLATAACDRGGADVVARAAGHDLQVEEATALLAPEAGLPNQPEVVQALADLWIDYALLATAAAEDSTFSQLDLEPLLTEQKEIEMITVLRDSVIQVDTALSDADVRQRFAREAPGARVRVRHILLQPPEGATPAQRDSVRALASELLARIRAGESFEDLARQYSVDATAAQGGDLGFFGRGEMVGPFDSASFALEPGEVSDVVATPFGYHIIRVDEKDVPAFEELGEDFRGQMQAELIMRAESLYVTGVEARGNVEIAEGATDVVREVARNPTARLAGRAGRRALVEYQEGEVTVDEVRTFLQPREPNYRSQVVQATDQQIVDNILRQLAQRELLITEAESRGIGPSQDRQDSVQQAARNFFREAALELGLLGIQPAEGESREQAIERAVSELLRGILRAEREVIPLGGISALTLRRQYPVEVMDEAVQRVVTQVAAARGPAQNNPFELPPDGPPSPPDGPPAPPTDSAAGPAPAPGAPGG